MKKLLTFTLFLILLSGCVTSKHKIKDKEASKASTDMKKNLESNEKVTVSINDSKKDSVSSNSKYSLNRDQLFTSQNFQLKSNGKCGDPGALRNVEFTDALGNKTSIPVNDNTELNFLNETEMKKEIESLKIKNNQLTETNSETKSKYEKALSEIQELKQKTSLKSSNTDTKSESSTIWQFILCGVLSIIVWKVLEKLIKKYLP